jgi:hypothetical protein
MIIAPNKSDFLGQLDDDVTPIGWDVTVTYATPAGAAAVGTVQPFSGIGTAQAGGAFQQDYQALFGVNVQSTALLGVNGHYGDGIRIALIAWLAGNLCRQPARELL